MQIQLLHASVFEAASKEQMASVLDVWSNLEHIEPKTSLSCISETRQTPINQLVSFVQTQSSVPFKATK